MNTRQAVDTALDFYAAALWHVGVRAFLVVWTAVDWVIDLYWYPEMKPYGDHRSRRRRTERKARRND